MRRCVVGGLLGFLLGVLVLVVVLVVVKLVMDYLELPPPVRQLAMLIVAGFRFFFHF